MAANFNLNPYAFRCVMEYLEPCGIFALAQISKDVCWFSNDQNVWFKKFAEHKLPLVESLPDQPRNYKQDFKTLYPITLNGNTIEQVLGVEILGELPHIDVRVFNLLSQLDFSETGKTMDQTFVFAMIPGLMKRPSSKEFPCIMDKERNLIKKEPWQDSETGEELLIPFSIRNLAMLASYPLIGEKRVPVFRYFFPEVLDQSKPYSDKVSVVFMRRESCCRNMSYSDQENYLGSKGFKITPVEPRALYDAVYLLRDGKCPETQDQKRIYARTSTPFKWKGEDRLVAITGRSSRADVDFQSVPYCATRDMGIIPCCLADAP